MNIHEFREMLACLEPGRVLERFDVELRPAQLTELEECPGLERVRSLGLYFSYGVLGLARFEVLQRIARRVPVVAFRFERIHVRLDVLDQMTQWPDLVHLRSLEWKDCRINTIALGRLLASRHLSRLRILDLSNNRLTLGAGRLLANWKWLGSLEVLVLNGNPRFEDRGLRALLSGQPRSPRRLRRLGLSGCGLTVHGARALVRAARMRNLSHVELANNRLDDLAALALVRWKRLKQLQVLDLSGNQIGQGGTALLESAQRSSAVSLEGNQLFEFYRWLTTDPPAGPQRNSMSLRSRYLSEDMIALLLRPGKLRDVVELDLASASFENPDSRVRLLEAPALTQLEALDVSGTGLRLTDLLPLVSSRYPCLRSLLLNDHEPLFNDVLTLLLSPQLRRLEKVQIGAQLTGRDLMHARAEALLVPGVANRFESPGADVEQEASLLKAVLDCPQDDTVRMVYADWLDDHGDPRGEFIRSQCLLATLPESDPRRPALQEHVAQYLSQDYISRLGLTGLLLGHVHVEFQRGLIHGMTLAVQTLQRLAGDISMLQFLATLHPLRWLAIADGTPETTAAEILAHSPFLDHLERLELTGYAWDSGGYWGPWETHATQFSPAQAHLLAEAPHLQSLQILRLQSYEMGPEARDILRNAFGDRVTLPQ